MTDQANEAVPTKVIKRVDSLIKSAGSGFVISLIGIFIPFLAFIGMAVGFGYMFEAKGLLAKQTGLDQEREERLQSAVGRFKFMGILGAVISLLWILVVGGIILSM